MRRLNSIVSYSARAFHFAPVVAEILRLLPRRIWWCYYCCCCSSSSSQNRHHHRSSRAALRLHLFVLKKKNITARLTTRGEENRITSFAVVSSSSSSSLFFDIARFFFSMRAPEEKSEEKKRKKKTRIACERTNLSLSRARVFVDRCRVDRRERKKALSPAANSAAVFSSYVCGIVWLQTATPCSLFFARIVL